MSQIASASFTANKRGDALPPPPPAEICKALGIKELTVEWLAGDGSDRCYYRVFSPEVDGPLVLMQLSGSDAIALKENGYEWIQIGDLLSQQDIFVPRTVATLPDAAAIIIEDYGDIMMESVAHQALEENRRDDVYQLYHRSFNILQKFLKIPPSPDSPWCQRRFDAERFEWEIQFFAERYLKAVANITFDSKEQAQFDREAKDLAQFLAEGSKYFVHRDFHSRNVMVKDERLAVIDFQDARYGPAAYDLVSLCFDSYVPFSLKERMDLIEKGIRTISEGNHEIAEDINSHWPAMLLQRQLKAIGSFGYLSVEKNRGNYLQYVKPALETLDPSIISDKRWPFLSSKLIERISKKLG